MMSEVAEKEVRIDAKFGCISCGSDLKYKPGTTHLKCEYCGAENDIPVLDEAIEEQDFHEFLEKAATSSAQLSINIVKCDSCGASATLEPNIVSSTCPYCARPLVITNAHMETVIQPKSLLPFKVDKKEATEAFQKWIGKLWFAPSALKKAVLSPEQFKGIYIPFWTYDTFASTQYIGQRGDYYYETEYYTAQENGKTVNKSRQVRHTRWLPAFGTVSNDFDDVLVAASKSLPEDKLAKLEPWDLENLVPFEAKFLSGFITEKYQVDISEGFELAKDIMEDEISRTVRLDIGGDEQRINQMNTKYSNITFKHILLPVYVSAYQFKGKAYRFLVNARTKEVQGERPWSAWKIFFAIVFAIAAIVIIYNLSQKA